MPSTASVTVYQFDELDDRAKEKAREWYREGAFDYNWWDFTYEDAKHVLAECGFTIDQVFFSGFWSQGDGACFEGRWAAGDVKPGKAVEEAPQDERVRGIATAVEALALKYPDAGMRVKHRGHYSHEYCTEFETWLGTREIPDDGSALWMGQEDIVDEEAEKEIVEFSRDAMRWIYRQLEAEYDYQNADEQVDDAIRANEYEFTEDGRRYRY